MSKVNNVEVSYNKPNKGVVDSEETSSNPTPTICTNVEGTTVDTCSNSVVGLNPITSGVVAKIPVVLAELNIRMNVVAEIDLPEPALEIKDIKKRLKITQCMLLQNTNVLFIKGFVRKNIDYSTRTCSNSEGVCGDIRHCTVDVPFQCTTNVTFNGLQPAPIINTSKNEFEYFKAEELPNQFAEKDELLSGDLSEYNQVSSEYFNELPYCELISSRIVEFDEYLNRKPIPGSVPFEERTFRKIEEKMVINVTLKLLQKRQVSINNFGIGGTCDCKEE
ncbi:MAG: hypothetical protein FH753_11585 [Firmicutes bacterium]|nr:hypothetical protein [Bacillota bacterium]